MYLCVLDKKLASGFNAYVLYFQKLPLACQNLQRTCYRKYSEHGQIARNILNICKYIVFTVVLQVVKFLNIGC